ncbi:MAG: Connector [Bacteriophage sp.]|nr:MAG: Connector [Bacteriophage sp.]
MPDTIDVRYLEQVLITQGAAVFFRDEVLGFLCLPVTLNGKLDVYGNPRDFVAISDTGYTKNLNVNNGVIIYNNYLRTPNIFDIKYYADRLYQYDRIIDVNINAQKTPILIKADQNEILTMKNVYQKYDGNQPVIYGKKTLSDDSLTVLKTDAPWVADKIYDLKAKIWNEALTQLGIPNSDTTKRERMIKDEVLTAQGAVIATRNSPEKMRQIACDKINKMFGLDIWYQFDSLDIDSTIKKEVSSDELLHNDSEGDMRDGGRTDV